MRKPAPFVVLGFLLGMSAFAAWSRRALTAPPGVPGSLVSLSTVNPAQAKRRHLFWIWNNGGEGYAADLLSDVRAFASVFPGYEASRSNPGLWEFYFTQTFNGQIRSGTLEKTAGEHSMVPVSWIGNLELFRTCGADVVVLGNSETFRALRPGELAGAIPMKDPKILLVVKNSAMPSTILQTARTMARSGKKAHVVVWGYSSWGGYPGSTTPAEKEEERFLLGEYASALGARGTPSATPAPISWDDLLPRRVGLSWSRAARLLGLPPGPETGDRGLRLPRGAETDPLRVAEIAKTSFAGVPRLKGISEKDCDTTAASAELDAALNSILAYSQRVVLYIPPTTPLVAGSMPACFPEAISRMVSRKAGPRVTVETGGWKDYGLDYADFTEDLGDPAWIRLDENHVNSRGSHKVTARIARILRHVFSGESSAQAKLPFVREGKSPASRRKF